MKNTLASTFAALLLGFLATASQPAWAQAIPAPTSGAVRVIQRSQNGLSFEVVEMFGEGDDEVEFVDDIEGEAVETGEEGDSEAQQEKQERLQKIQQLRFDRRPSTILATWKAFELKQIKDAEKEAADKKKAEEAATAEGNAEEGAAEDSTPKEGSSEEETSPETEATETDQTTAESDSVENETTESPASETEDTAEQASAESSEEESAVAPPEGNAEEANSESAGETSEESESEEEPSEPEGPSFAEQLKQLQQDVTLGRWDSVKAFLETLEEDEAKAVYEKIVKSLATTPSQPPVDASPEVREQLQQLFQMQNQRGAQPETNVISLDDYMAIVKLAPAELDETQVRMLAGLVRVYLASGYQLDELLHAFQQELSQDEETRAFDATQVVDLLMQSGHTLKADAFLPKLEEAIENQQFKSLIQLSRYFYALYRKDHRVEDLEKAWKSVQEILAAEEVEETEQQLALTQAVDLAPQVRENLGQEWLADAFREASYRGVEILSTIGNQSARALQANIHDPGKRLQLMKLQSTAVEALVETSPETAELWKDKLSVLASVWLREAEVSYQFDTSDSRRPALQRDMYGNIFYYDTMQVSRSRNSNDPEAIAVDEILKIQPSNTWLKYVDEGLRPKIDKQVAQLLLKVNEEDEAFPYIERLAQTHPEVADSLVSDFLRIWTDNHDPNVDRNRTNSYVYMYGFEQRAESIPLTRSKQERNLKELAELVERLNALPLDNVDESLLAKAFTTCHSSAEVYKLEAIAKVFGPIDNLKPETLAALAEQMRTNLVGMWRVPAVQKDAKTNRKQRDIALEVQRGYEVALAVVQGGLAKHPDDWSLVLAQASLRHDANDFRREIAPDSQFVDRLENAFDDFQLAADLYSKTVGDIREDQETTQPFEIWYYASLGACDPGRLSQDKPKDPSQLPLIRQAILSLPGDAADRHMAKFANSLFTRMSSIKPALKYRYLESGLTIVGDHERAEEAQKIFDYYADLVTEIKLETKIDGSDTIGKDKPFGVFVNLVHTREIERESGGFSRYLQNQNNGSRYYYNYGRPLENYRDKFEEQVVSAVGDSFEVLSVTFQSEDVNSRSLPEYGWRYTPYAYVLLKAKAPEVDKIPSFQVDLDFLDTSGYAVIPISSPPLPVDAATAPKDPRPADQIRITQTLDERQAKDGLLVLEVKAVAQGLVPDLDELLSIEPEGFEVTEVKDEGLSISQFDPDSPSNVILSERSWLVNMETKEDLPTPPTSFEFAEPKLEVTEAIYQRYDDADLLAVDSVIELESQYASTASTPWWWYAGPIVVILGVIALIVAFSSRQPIEVTQNEFAMPERITPFSVIGLLDRIESRNGIDAKQLQELRQSRQGIEQYYFEEEAGEKPDLVGIARTWSQQARPRG
ncbi:hypothetical protein [Aeoliella mucimassa]|uniref:Uncharacterized protein n=1 Tax=Aeoliella mucimassa TaxID=2527972 RepID=A0A518AP95_9BACT|nr:hypothetical protein [Aeoliella mucimassa]QDU56534.1 hypothetical protein Pan181_27440 [Aeoliella mucimassa]